MYGQPASLSGIVFSLLPFLEALTRLRAQAIVLDIKSEAAASSLKIDPTPREFQLPENVPTTFRSRKARGQGA